jgi:type VI protein secretion system component Hcp
MESKCRLRLTGIPGTEWDRAFADWIPLAAFNQAIVPGQHLGTGTGAIDCMINKGVDAVTPLLAKAVGEGIRFPEAVVELAGASDQVRIELRLLDIALEGWNLAPGNPMEGPVAFESFSLRASQAEWIVHPPQGAPVRSAWDPRQGPVLGKPTARR